MAVMTVALFAAQLGRPTTALLEQLQSAGVTKQSPDDALTESDTERLLDFLRTSHGTTAGAERKKITLTKKTSTEIKQADSSGRARTIQVEVRKKRVFVKRDDVPAGAESTGPSAEELTCSAARKKRRRRPRPSASRKKNSPPRAVRVKNTSAPRAKLPKRRLPKPPPGRPPTPQRLLPQRPRR